MPLHSKRAIIGPPAKRHLNGVSLACRRWPNIECWLGSLVIFQGIRTSITKKSYIFVIFRGGGGPDPLSPPLRICTWLKPDLDSLCFQSRISWFSRVRVKSFFVQ